MSRLEFAGKEIAAVIRITAKLRSEILQHCRSQHPLEACGVITGSGPVLKGKLRKMHNVAERPAVQYRFEPTEQLKVWQQAERNHERIQAIYHSHPNSFGYPSALDIEHALENTIWIIVATSGLGKPFRAFTIKDGKVQEQIVMVER